MQPAANNVVIRPAIAEDLSAYRDLRLEALRNHPEAFGADYAQDAAQPESFWQERLSNTIDNPMGILHLAVADQMLIGMTGIYRINSPKEQHNGNIWGVYVRPDRRGLHVAEALIEACVIWAKAKQLRNVKLKVNAANVGAIRCYSRCRFTVYGVDPDGLFIDSTYYDELLMVRRL